MNKYYTYVWLNEDGMPFYVGRGSGRRAWKSRYRKGEYVVAPSKEKVLVLKKDLTFEESCRHEKYIIYVLGRKIDGGILINESIGGKSGGSGCPKPNLKNLQKSGSDNPMYGVHLKWITNKSEETMIPREEIIPEGWEPGRKSTSAETRTKMSVTRTGQKRGPYKKQTNAN